MVNRDLWLGIDALGVALASLFPAARWSCLAIVSPPLVLPARITEGVPLGRAQSVGWGNTNIGWHRLRQMHAALRCHWLYSYLCCNETRLTS